MSYSPSQPSSRRRFLAGIAIFLALLSLYAAGLGLRRLVLHTQEAAIGDALPFTLESALHFRRVKMLYDRGVLPDIDPAIQHPEGINIRNIDAVASEPVQALLAGWFPESIPFAARLRWIEAGWFCLAIPLLAIAMRIWTSSWWSGFFTGAIYAVSIASVLRSTGQEISRENFALPWLMASFVAAAALLRPSAARSPITATCLSAISAFFFARALISWDMIQYVLVIITLAMSVHVIRRAPSADPCLNRWFRWLAAAVFLTGLLNAYHRYHGLAWSPLMVWMAGVVAAGYLQPSTLNLRPRVFACAAIFGPVAALLLLGLTGAYGASYNHFAELLWAKIRFLNVKPEDPGLLTFYQRVMWTPALHSATWPLTTWMFPFTVWLVIPIAALAWFDSLKRPDPLIRFWIVFFIVSVVAFILMVRFHVFVAMAVAVLAGWSLGRLGQTGWPLRTAAILMLIFAVLAEARHTLDERSRMGRPNTYYEEMTELADYLREQVAPQPVLANMGVSGFIAAYAKCPIAIHPKFEDPTIRERLQRYGAIMFGADERALRDWMDELALEHLVYSKGEFASVSPEYQMRYFVNQLNPPDTVPARRFEQEDASLRYFTRLWGNHKYVVYQSLSATREAEAVALAADARRALEEGRLDDAEARAVDALAIDRHNEDALKVMRHVGSLIGQGVRVAPADE